jgi:hypothetical protein
VESIVGITSLEKYLISNLDNSYIYGSKNPLG